MAATTRWICLLCWSSAEWHVFNTVRRAGHRAFYPYMIHTARHGRWDQPIPKPQYPGYIFAGWEHGTSMEPLRRTIGVRDILRTGPDVVIISGRDMASFANRWRETYRESFPHRVVYDRVSVGDWIKVPDGFPFAGIPARIDTIDNHGQITASLGTLKVKFPTSALPKSVRSRPTVSRYASPAQSVSL